MVTSITLPRSARFTQSVARWNRFGRSPPIICSSRTRCTEEVRGAPNSLKSGEMHARALEALERAYQQKIDEMVAEWNHRVGAGVSSRLKEVVTAAHGGRVLTLLISNSDEKIGVYDAATHSVKARETGSPNEEDIMNEAAIQTIVHAGKVLIAPHHKMPNGSSLAAIFGISAFPASGRLSGRGSWDCRG